MLTTAFIERLNGPFRERLASLTRKSRQAASRLPALHTGMSLVGCTYHFCCAQQDWSKANPWGRACTPALASVLTDHVWSIGEWLRYQVAPSPWIEPKRRGRPRKQANQTVMLTKRQRFRPANAPCLRQKNCPRPFAGRMTSVPLATRGANAGRSSGRARWFLRLIAITGSAVLAIEATDARRPELRQALTAITRYLSAHQLPQARALLRLDGHYGTGAVLADMADFAFVTRGKDYTVLDHPRVQARLHLPPDQIQQRTAKPDGT